MNSQLHNIQHRQRSSSRSALQLYRDVISAFRTAEIRTAELDARLLICHACGITIESFIADPDRELSAAEAERIRQFTDRRCAREPVSRIIGSREFWGLDFTISPDTLDPRPDTETLVGAALEVMRERAGDRPPSILDLGTGSGCVLISLLHEIGSARGTGIDICERALRIAQKNAILHEVDDRAVFACKSWPADTEHAFDLVVSNPPYIPASEVRNLEPDVRDYDPPRALNGGGDGLDAYRAIISCLSSCLAPGGWIVFEVGTGQVASIKDMLGNNDGAPDFAEIRQWADLAERARCVGARRSPSL